VQGCRTKPAADVRVIHETCGFATKSTGVRHTCMEKRKVVLEKGRGRGEVLWNDSIDNDKREGRRKREKLSGLEHVTSSVARVDLRYRFN
jgi:hypothetical protein